MDTTKSSGITERQNRNIISYFSDDPTITFSYGETIVNGFDEPSGVYLIKKGFVKSYSTSHDGHANLLLIHEAGELIPLPWSLDGTNVTGLFYEAMDDVEVIKSSKDRLRITMGNNMWLTQEILNQTVNVIAVYTRRIQILEFRSARGRIIAELILLADRFGKLQGNKIIIRAPITHQDIADSINMNRETASRALEQLFEEGLVDQVDHLFAIDNMDKLKAALK
ncbi:MAG: Crp/Fnr family transcriptional regulator [Candidatus Saccharibacteria bacterium]|nr:Crp/Fnr family transcriptional regulator [Candidatus Saccharibacteria bacterium]